MDTVLVGHIRSLSTSLLFVRVVLVDRDDHLRQLLSARERVGYKAIVGNRSLLARHDIPGHAATSTDDWHGADAHERDDPLDDRRNLRH